MSDVVLAEVGENIDAGGLRTNVLQAGGGAPVVLVHGSGPGVTAYANWRLTVPDLAARFRVIAPDCGDWTPIEWAAEFNQLLVRFLGRPDR